MLRKGFRKEIKHLGTAAAVVLAMFSPLQVQAAPWANCNTGISDTSASAVAVTTNATSCVVQFKAGNTWTVPDGVNRAAVAIVGAGGGGGFGNIGGGGGGGEVMYNPSLNLTPGTATTIAIGTGGTGGWTLSSGTWAGGTRGGTTQFGSYYAGGGFGGPGSTVVSTTPSSVYGGSGSGTSGYSTSGQTAVKQSLTGWTSYANNGGAYNGTGGGGGGAGTAGAAGTGGNGVTLPAPLSAYTLAGGGGGWTAGAGGTGGGGKAVGANYTVSIDGGTNGTANTGGGGGAGMAGGSGTVIVQYYTSQSVSFNANGGTGTMATTTLGLASTLPANTFVRSGYTFKGWATSANGMVTVADQAQTPNTGDITYYAVWAGSTDQTLNVNSSGMADYMSNTTAQVIPATGAFTAEAWINPSSLALGNEVIMSQGTAGYTFFLKLTSAGNLSLYHYGANAGAQLDATQVAVPLNSWTHVAVSCDNTTANMYVNGQLQKSASFSWGSTQVYPGFIVGQWSSNTADTSTAFKGKIDQVKVWAGALTQAQIQRSMNAFGDTDTSGQITNSLRDAWGFNEGNGVTPYDFTNTTTLTASSALATAGSAGWASVATVDSTKGIYTFPRTYLTAAGGFQVPSTTTYDYLVVGGGGAGGYRSGGGGGAGGYLSSVGTASSRLSLNTGTVVSVVVGVGGIGNNTGHGVSGTNSSLKPVSGASFSIPDAVGGGGGGTGNFGCGPTGQMGTNGGSGGGSLGNTCTGNQSDPGSGTAGQGNAGGYGSQGNSEINWTGGGGGGALSAGAAGSTAGTAGNGGVGASNGITGAKVCYAAGGGGGTAASGTSGAGGACTGLTTSAGAGSVSATVAGSAVANTGSGGGGAGFTGSSNGTGGSGASGVVVLRATVSSVATPTFDTPVLTGSGTGFTVNVSNYDPYYTYTASITAGSVSIGALNGSSLPLTVTGLTAGQAFTLTVTASDGSLSSAATLLPPNAPSSVSIRAGNGKVIVSFTQVTSVTRPAVASYQYSLDGGTSWTNASQTSSPITITGLTNGTSYTVSIRTAGAGYGAGSTGATTLSGLVWDVWAKDYNPSTGVWTDSSPAAGNVGASSSWPTASSYPSSVNFTGNSYFYQTNAAYNSVTDAGKYSIAAWFKTSSSGKILGLEYAGAYDHQMYVGSDGKLYGGLCASTCMAVVSNSAVNDGVWRYAVHTFDGTTMKVYINGVLQSTTATANGNLVNYGAYWNLGGTAVTGWPSAGNGNYTGSLGHVSAYHRALSQAEITSLYNAEAAPYQPITLTFAGSTGATGTQANQTVYPGMPYPVPTTTTFTKAGYFLAGWSDGTNTYLPGDTYTMPAAGNVTINFTALWSYTSGNMTFDTQTGTTTSTPYPLASGVTLTTSTRTGYVLKGWYTDAAGTTLAGTGVPGSTYLPYSTSNLQLSYNFDDSSSYNGGTTTVTDKSPTGGLNGTVVGSPTFSPSSPGYLNFTGTTSGGPYILTPNLYTRVGSTNVSIFGWIYATGDGVVVNELGTTAIDSGWRDSVMEIVGGKLKVRIWSGGTVTSTASVTDNAWHYVGLTFSGTTLTGYIDGASFGTVTTSRVATDINTNQSLYYAVSGAMVTNLGSGSAGNFRLGSIQIYNAGLTAATVTQNFQGSCARFSVTGCTAKTLYAQWLTASVRPTASNPTSATRSVGQAVTFSTTASTTDTGTLSYQWYKDGVALSNGGAISGVTTNTLSFSSVVAASAGAYTVTVTNTLYSGQTYQSTSTTTTAAANLTVVGAPTITTPSGASLNGTWNTAYSLAVPSTVSTSARTYSVSYGSLPTGLSINAATGDITGSPTQSGTFTIQVRVTDDNGATATTATFAIVIATVAKTITFDSNYGTATTTTQTIQVPNTAVLTANSFTRVGYAFNGWNTAANGTGTAYTNGATVSLTVDTRLYAQWTSNLILDFDATDTNSWTGGATLTNRNGSYPSATLTNGAGGTYTNTNQSITFPGPNPATGNNGSYGSIGNINTSLFQTGLTLDFYANFGSTANNWERIIDFGKWKSTSADASYNIQAGRAFQTGQIELEIFNLTSGTSSSGLCVSANNVIDGAMHRYTFVLNGSTCVLYVDGAQQNVKLGVGGTSAASVAYGLPINNIVLDTNYIARSNWSADTSFEGQIRSIRLLNTAITPANIDLIDSGRLVYKTVTYSSGQTATLPSSLVTTGQITLPTAAQATRTGYALANWYKDSGLTTLAGAPGASFTPTAAGTTTLYAAWTSVSFNVTYDYRSATGGNTVPSATFTTGGTAITLPTPTKTGYVFAGWYSELAYTNLMGSAGASFSPTSDYTLYAKWLTAAAAPTVGNPTGASKTAGQSVTFTTSSSSTDGGTLSYQWYKDGNAIAGATGSSYTIASLAVGDAGSYTVTVSNKLYSGQTYESVTSATSAGATLTVAAAPTITTPSAGLSATYNTAYSLSITGTAGTAGKTFSIVGTAPTGLSINASTGAITGTPSAAGNFAFQVRVTDDNGATATTSSFTISVAKANQSISFGSLANKTLGSGTVTLSATASSGLTVTFTTADSTYCTVSGTTLTLVAAGTCTVRADQSGDTNFNAATQVPQTFTIATSLTITTPSSGLSGTYNTAYTLNLSSSGGAGSNTWAIATGTLPAGLAINASTGVISGTPSAAGSQTISVRVTDANGAQVTTNAFQIVIAKATQGITWVNIAGRSINSGSFDSVITLSSGLTPTMTSNVTNICTVSGSTITLKATGTCALTFSQAGDSNWLPIYSSNNNKSFVITGLTTTFNSNYGTATTSTQSITTAGNVALTTNSFTRPGYTFAGWNTAANGSGTAYTNGQAVTFTANTTLYAQWSTTSQTVTYALNGGTGTAPTQANTATTATFTVAAGTGLSKTGYTFGGWNDGTANYAAGDTYTMGASNVTLTAVWTANTYVVTYSYNQATGGYSTASSSFTTAGTTITLPTPTRTGYTFSGWYDDSVFTNLIGLAGASYSPTGATTAITLYAKWAVAVSSISYDANGGTGSAAATSGNTLATVTIGNGTGITRGGYTLVGWNTAANMSGTEYLPGGTLVMPAGGITLYADWNANSYTVNYNTGGGSSVASGSYVTAGSITLPSAPTYAGYTFNGWFAASSGGSALGSTYSPSGYGNITIYAQWTANAQTISYNANNGTGSIADVGTTTGASVGLASGSALNRTGYTLAKWNTAANGSGTDYALSATVTVPAGGLALYAIWTPINYTITYNANSATAGSAPTDSANYNIGQSLTVKANSGNLVRTGYTFAGWNTAADGSGTTYTSGNQFTVGSANMTLYAKWTANTYTITYNANGATGSGARGGSSVTSDSYTTAGSTVTLPDVGTMTKRGYNFGGWSTTPSGSALSSGIAAAYTTTANVTLYAVWNIKTINVTYSKGTMASATFISFPSNATGNYASTITVGNGVDGNVTLNSTRYDFMGWSDGTSVYNAGNSYTLGDTDVTFTAIWVPVYAVRYIFNGGSAAGGENAFDSECPGTDGTCVNNTSITTNNAPSRTGYTFTGWVDQSGLAVAAASSYTVTDGHYLLYAQWTAINYKINYDSAGGSTAPTQADKNIGQVFTVGSSVTKTGYSFGGWDDGSQVYGVGASYTIGTSDVTLTARWIPDVYSVTYDWNGGHGSTVNPDSFTVGTSPVTLPLVTDHVKDGYDFNGWSTSANGSLLGTTYTPTGNTTLYAIWGAGSYTLTMNANGGSVGTSSFSVPNGNAQTLPDATRSHFHFDGWYTAAVAGTRVGGAGDSYTPNGSGTLYARWTQDSLYGMGSATKIGSLTVSNGVGTGITLSGPSNQVTVQYPAGALPNGTTLDLYLLNDTSRAASLISGSRTFLVNLVVAWLGSDGSVPTTATGKPVSVTIVDANIKAGAAVYTLIGNTATYVGTATQDGQVVVNITDDPELVIASTTPSAPLLAAATAGDGVVTVNWTAPSSTGGSAITSYLVTASNGYTCTAPVGTTTCDIHGLTNGSAYTFTVQALNSVGTSQSSLTTSSVTPMAAQSITFASPTNRTLGSGTYSLTAAASSSLAVAFSSADTSVCTVNGSTVTLVSAGTCTINANQSGNSSTLAAAQVSKSFTVAPALAITTPSSGLTGSYNSAFSLALSSTGGAGSNSYAISAGALPAGLSLDSTTGVISGTPTISGSSAVTVSVTDANGATTATTSFTLAMATIAQSALSVTTTSGTYGTGLTLAVSGGTTSGSVTYSVTAGSTTCSISGGVLTAAGAGDCSVTATMAGNSYYSAVNSGATTVSFAKATQSSLSLTTLSGTFGTPLTLNTSGGSGNGAVTYTTSAGTTSCTVNNGVLTASGAGSCNVTATKASDSNYNSVTASSATVIFAAANQSALTITTTSGTFGSALNLQTSGGAGTGSVSYSVSAGTTTCTITGNVLTAAGTGDCSVTATKAADSNYNSVSSSATLISFSAASQSPVSLTSTSGVYGTGLTLAATGGNGTGGYSYTVANGTTTCTLSSGVLSVAAAGSCLVTATRAGDSNYSAASSAATTVNFGLAPQSISFTGLNNQTLNGGAAANVATATATSNLAVSFSSLTPAVCTISSGTVALVSAGTCTIAADQAGDTGYAAASRVSQSFTVAPALTVTTPSSGLTGSYNSSYSLALTSGGGSGSRTFAIASGSLPAGLSLNTATGVISGVPSVSGSGTVTISVTDANGAVATSSSFTITISTIAQSALSLTSTTGTFGSNLTLAVSGGSTAGSVSYSVTAGTTSCTLTNGVLTAAGAGTCSVTANMAGDAYYSAVSTGPVTVTFAKAAQAALSVTSVSGTYGSGLTLATSGGSGIGGVSYSVAAGTTTCTLMNGVLTAAGAGSCDVTATKASDNDYTAVSSNATTVTFAAAGQSAVLVTSTSGVYGTDLTLAASGGSGTGVFSFTASAGTTTCTLLNGVLTAAAGGTCLVTATRASDANHLSASSAATTVTFAKAVQTVSFGSLTNQTIGGGATLNAPAATATSGLTVTFSSLTSSICTLTNGSVNLVAAGTCTIAADQTGDARYNAATRVTQSFQVAGALTLTTPTAGLSGTVGSAYSLLLSDNGGAGSHTFTLASGTLPAGILLDQNTGLISGTATAVGAVSVSVRVTDANGAFVDTAVFSLDFVAAPLPPAPVVTPVANPLTIGNPGAILGRFRNPLSGLIAATGGTGRVTYAISGSLPEGVSFNTSNGAISGTPTAAGSFSVIVTATDSAGASVSSPAFTIQVAKAAQEALILGGSTGTVGTPLNVAVSGGSGTGLVNLTVAGGTASGCAITGQQLTATAPGTCVVTATKAGDANLEQATATATINFLAKAAPHVDTWEVPVVVTPDTGSGTGTGTTIEPNTPVLVKDGVASGVTTTINATSTGLVITTSEWKISFSASSSGANGPVDSSVSGSQLVVTSGSTVSVAGDKFQADSVVQVWVHSSPFLLGTVQVRPDGSFDAALPLPAGLELGSHTLMLQGLNSSLEVQNVQAPLLVKAPVVAPSAVKARILFASTGAHVTTRIQRQVNALAKALAGKTGIRLVATSYFRTKVSIPRANQLAHLRAARVAKLLKRKGITAVFSYSVKPNRAPLVSQIFDLAQAPSK